MTVATNNTSPFFLIGLIVAWLAITAPILVGQVGYDPEHPPVTLCELESAPQNFKNQEFEVSAVYNVGFEMGWLSDSCVCSKKEFKVYAINYRFENGYGERTTPSVLKQFKKLTSQKPDRATSLRRIPGKFLIRLEEYQSKSGLDKRFQFEVVVLKVISVGK